MKRFLTLLLAAAMVLSFAACGDNGTTIRNEKEAVSYTHLTLPTTERV